MAGCERNNSSSNRIRIRISHTVQAWRQTGACENQRPAPAELTVNNKPASFFTGLNHSQTFSFLPLFDSRCSDMIWFEPLCCASSTLFCNKRQASFLYIPLFSVDRRVPHRPSRLSKPFLVGSFRGTVLLSSPLGLEVQSRGH